MQIHKRKLLRGNFYYRIVRPWAKFPVSAWCGQNAYELPKNAITYVLRERSNE